MAGSDSGGGKPSSRFAASRINTLINKGLRFAVSTRGGCRDLTSLVVVSAAQNRTRTILGNRKYDLVLEL